MKKIRIDEYLVLHDYYDTVDLARRAIMAGLIYDDNIRVDTVGEKINPDTIKLRVKDKRKKYVSRGGLKLEKAIHYFKLNLQNKILLDIGSSTGGFTDCALKHGVKHSYALDVGTNQLAYQLRINPSVTVMEQTNFRNATKSMFKPLPNVVSIDVSFISLKVIFETLNKIIEDNTEIIALVKPQFEVDKSVQLEKGIVTDKNEHFNVLTSILNYCQANHLKFKGLTYSPVTGGKGNIEYLLYIKKQEKKTDEYIINDQIIQDTVESAFATLKSDI